MLIYQAEVHVSRPRRPRLLGTALLVAGLIGAACSSDDDEPLSGDDTTSTTTSSASTTTTVQSVPLSAENDGPIVFVDPGSAGIFVQDARGEQPRQVSHPTGGASDGNPSWSPDGSTVLFTRCAEVCRLWTVGADGTNEALLGDECPPNPTPATCPESDHGAYSPDGTQLAFSRASGDVVNGLIEDGEVYVMNADGTGARAVTDNEAFSSEASRPSWSPDGTELVFRLENVGATTEPTGGRALFTVNLDGSGLQQLTPWELGASGQADWSPAGDLIAFRAVDDEEEGAGNFFTIKPDGTSLTQVTDFDDVVISHKVTFSPDGALLMFTKHERGADGLFTIELDGSHLQPVAGTPEESTAPDWLPSR